MDTNAIARDLTPGDNVKASNLIINKRFPDELLVSTNERDPTCFDMYRVDYKTGTKTLDTQNPGDVLGWGVHEPSNQVRQAVVKNQADSSTTVRVRDNAQADWRDLITFPYGENGNLLEFCNDDKSLLGDQQYWTRDYCPTQGRLTNGRDIGNHLLQRQV